MSRLTLTLILLSLAAAAQSISGWIGGVTVPGARVKLTSAETARTRELVADSAGRFQLLHVFPGEYTVEINAPGFVPLTRTLALGLNQEMELEAPLAQDRGEPAGGSSRHGSFAEDGVGGARRPAHQPADRGPAARWPQLL